MPTMRGCGSEHRLRKPPRAESELMERQSEREHQSQREHQSERERERELCVRENCVRRRRTERSRGRGGRDPWPLAEEHGAGHVGERALEQRHDARVHGRVGVALRLQARHHTSTRPGTRPASATFSCRYLLVAVAVCTRTSAYRSALVVLLCTRLMSLERGETLRTHTRCYNPNNPWLRLS